MECSKTSAIFFVLIIFLVLIWFIKFNSEYIIQKCSLGINESFSVSQTENYINKSVIPNL